VSTIPSESPVNQPVSIMLRTHVVKCKCREAECRRIAGFSIVIRSDQRGSLHLSR
jgi:hypothetical protein